MDIIFLGTRGNTDVCSRRHRRHSALLVCHEAERVMIDCGADWLHAVEHLSPSAIVVTHAHPDHAAGLAEGAPCPVFATAEAWASLALYPIRDQRIVRFERSFRIGGLRLEAFPVEHSIRAPAVGYRISGARASFFYVPDVVAIIDRPRALEGVELYIGDGATISRPMVRRQTSGLVGHTPIRTQLGWCQKESVRQAIFTHCGTEIVTGSTRHVARLVAHFGEERGVPARIAYDGLRLAFPLSIEEASSWASRPPPAILKINPRMLKDRT
jgi:phosphoribosyl 1,2-cyclic phosphodiesterase